MMRIVNLAMLESTVQKAPKQFLTAEKEDGALVVSSILVRLAHLIISKNKRMKELAKLVLSGISAHMKECQSLIVFQLKPVFTSMLLELTIWNSKSLVHQAFSSLRQNQAINLNALPVHLDISVLILQWTTNLAVQKALTVSSLRPLLVKIQLNQLFAQKDTFATGQIRLKNVQQDIIVLKDQLFQQPVLLERTVRKVENAVKIYLQEKI